TLCDGRNVLDGAWHHVALTRRAINGDMRIFVDGTSSFSFNVPLASGDVSYNPAHLNPTPPDAFLVLGAAKRDVVTARAFNGLMDELRLSTSVRYLGNFLPSAVPLVADADTAALYHFDETTGTDILDASNGNASPGVLIPAPAGAAAH